MTEPTEGDARMGGVEDRLAHRLLAAFRWVDPGPHATHEVSDTTGWWRDASLLTALGPALADLFADAAPTVVLGPQTSGVLLGPLVARALSVGFVEAYKDDRGRIADRMLRRATAADHKGRIVTLAVRARLISEEDRVLVVDDWAVTGAQLAALRSVVRQAGAEYLGAAVIVDGCPPSTSADLGLRSLLRRRELDSPAVRRVGSDLAGQAGSRDHAP